MLQKYMVAVDEFIKSKNGTEEVETDHGMRFVKKKSRKELRKEKRKMKKAKMKSYYEGKKTLDLPLDDGKESAAPADKQQEKKMEKAKKEVSKTQPSKSSSGPANKSDNSKTPSSKKGKKINKLQESRKMALMEANEDEDREIKKLERCLGLNKRKNKKSLPQSFVADGLDYILGVLDSGSSAVGMYDDDDDMDMAKENFEKLGENDSQLSDEGEKPEDEMASEGSDEGSFDDENEPDEEEEESGDDDDEMVDEEEEMEDDDEMVGEEEEEEMEDELDESNAVDSDDESEVETEREADTPDTKTSGSKSESVSLDIFYYCRSFDISCAV